MERELRSAIGKPREGVSSAGLWTITLLITSCCSRQETWGVLMNQYRECAKPQAPEAVAGVGAMRERREWVLQKTTPPPHPQPYLEQAVQPQIFCVCLETPPRRFWERTTIMPRLLDIVHANSKKHACVQWHGQENACINIWIGTRSCLEWPWGYIEDLFEQTMLNTRGEEVKRKNNTRYILKQAWRTITPINKYMIKQAWNKPYKQEHVQKTIRQHLSPIMAPLWGRLGAILSTFWGILAPSLGQIAPVFGPNLNSLKAT